VKQGWIDNGVTPSERADDGELDKAFHNSAQRDPILGLQDVFWALLNSNEFIMNN